MDFLKNAANQFSGSGQQQQGQQQGQQQHQGEGYAPSGPQHQQPGTTTGGGGGFLDGLKDKMNSAAGGGRESEKDEDYLDKAVDMVQEKLLGQGPQDNESAVEQAKDEQISDYIRGRYKTATGSDMPIKDKPTRFG